MAKEKFSFAPLKGFTPFEGRDAVPWIGSAEVRIVGVSTGTSPNDESRKYFKILAEILDADAAGVKIGGQVFYAGEDKNGDSMARQFGELLYSRGMSIEDICAAADQGVEMDIDEIIKSLKDPEKRAYAKVGADIDPKSGRQTSPIDGWITKDQHEKNKANARHRQDLPPAILAKLGVLTAGGGGTVPDLGGATNGKTTVSAPAGAPANAPGSRVIKL